MVTRLHKRKVFLETACLVILLVIAIPSSISTPAFASKVSADITSGAASKTTNAFSPGIVEINVGDSVTWTNRDSQPHTVTSGTAGQPDGKFDSSPNFNPLLAPQNTFSHIFEEAGEFPYYCGLHPNMVGSVLVAPVQSPVIVITAKTDRSSYETGDIVTVFGKLSVTDGVINQPLLLQVIDPEGLRDRIDQFDAEAGDYSYSFVAGGLMNTEGIYEILVSYRTTTAKATFDFKLDQGPSDVLFCGREVGDFAHVLQGTANSDLINGTNLDDLIRGFGGNDIIDGKGGNDCLIGNGGRDILYGGPGDDSIYGGDGDDKIYGNNGNDVLYGNAGNDLISGGDGDDYLAGKSGNDDLFGNNGNDKMFGNDGSDYLKGGDGDDIMFGGDGDDRLDGNAGNDRLNGQGDNDNIKGQRGDDKLSGGMGTDALDGGRNSDKCYDSALSSSFVNCEERILTFNERITVEIFGRVTETYSSGDSVVVEGVISEMLDNEDVLIIFNGPQGTTQTNNFGQPFSDGYFDSVFDIPNDADDGVWTVEVVYDGDKASTYFIVDDMPDAISVHLNEEEGIYEAGDDITIAGFVNEFDFELDTVEIKVLDPDNDEIIDEDVELDNDEFEFSFDLYNDARPGRYAVLVTYDVDNQTGSALFEIAIHDNDSDGDGASEGGLSAMLDQRSYAPGDEVKLSGTVDLVDDDNVELRLVVEGPDGSQIADYNADIDTADTGEFIYEFDLSADAEEGSYYLIISYDVDEVTLELAVD